MKKRFLVLSIVAMLVLSACGAETEDREERHPKPEVTEQVTATETPVPATPTAAVKKSIKVEIKAHEEDAVVTVELPKYVGVRLIGITEEELNGSIAQLMESLGSEAAVEGPAENGDTVNINYAGYMDGVAFAGGTNDSPAGYDLVLGSHSFISGFEEGLIGVMKGQEVDLNIAFPDPYYNNPDLSGKPVLFKVKVNEIIRKTVPELNDEFAATVGYESAEELRNAIKKDLNNTAFRTAVENYLIENSVVTGMPEKESSDIVSEYVDQYYTYAVNTAAEYEMDVEYVFQYFTGYAKKEDMEAAVSAQVKEALICQYVLEAIFENENLSYTQEDLEKCAEQYIESFGYDTYEAFVAENGEASIIAEVKMNKSLDYVISNANREE
ncbi:MAG: FKBP-type peptidyl-prolyl cis-trans isomerase [Lachnospiraceae bacterium]|nr:FKBP-type peptidyl-prolyl cis-trans isomerase [Lachnospiraceae bacterium]